MKNTWLILGLLGLGGIAYYMYNKKKDAPKVLDVDKIEKEIKASDEKKFTNAFLSQYDVVIAHSRVKEKAMMEADVLLADRDKKEKARVESYKPSYI